MERLCPSCKKEMAENSQFCPECGAFSKIDAQPANKNILTFKNIAAAVCSLALLTIISIAVFSFDVFGLRKNEKAPVSGAGERMFTAELTPVSAEGKWGYINTSGEMEVPAQYTAALRFQDRLNGYAAVSENGLFGYIKENGEYAIEPQYDIAGKFNSSGMALVCKNGVYGYIDSKGRLYGEYIYATDFSGGEYAYGVKKTEYGEEYILISSNAKECHTASDRITQVYGDYFVTTAPVLSVAGEESEIIAYTYTLHRCKDGQAVSLSGEDLIGIWDIITITDRFILFGTRTEGSWYSVTVTDKELNVVSEDTYFYPGETEECTNGLILYKKTGNTYSKVLLDSSMKEIFTENTNSRIVSGLDKNGYACIKENGQYCAYTKDGKVFSSSRPFGAFNCSLAPFADENGRIGYINADGGTAIQPIYDFATEFSADGYAVVFENDNYKIIDAYGTVVFGGMDYPAAKAFYSDTDTACYTASELNRYDERVYLFADTPSENGGADDDSLIFKIEKKTQSDSEEIKYIADRYSNAALITGEMKIEAENEKYCMLQQTAKSASSSSQNRVVRIFDKETLKLVTQITLPKFSSCSLSGNLLICKLSGVFNVYRIYDVITGTVLVDSACQIVEGENFIAVSQKLYGAYAYYNRYGVKLTDFSNFVIDCDSDYTVLISDGDNGLVYSYMDIYGNICGAYSYAEPFNEYGYAAAEKTDGSYCCLDKDMNEVFASSYEFKAPENGLAVYLDYETQKTGYLDLNGNVVISAQFDSAGDFYADGYALVRKPFEADFSVINENGEIFADSAEAKTDDAKLYSLNHFGSCLEYYDNLRASGVENYDCLFNDGTTYDEAGMRNIYGELLTDESVCCFESQCYQLADGSRAYITYADYSELMGVTGVDGRYIIQPRYREISLEDGYISVCGSDSKWLKFSPDGKQLISEPYLKVVQAGNLLICTNNDNPDNMNYTLFDINGEKIDSGLERISGCSLVKGYAILYGEKDGGYYVTLFNCDECRITEQIEVLSLDFSEVNDHMAYGNGFIGVNDYLPTVRIESAAGNTIIYCFPDDGIIRSFDTDNYAFFISEKLIAMHEGDTTDTKIAIINAETGRTTGHIFDNSASTFAYEPCVFTAEGAVAFHINGEHYTVDEELNITKYTAPVHEDDEYIDEEPYPETEGETEPIFTNGFALVKKNGGWAYMKEDGTYLNGVYEYASEFYADGLAIVRTDMDYYVINSHGNIIAKAPYTLKHFFYDDAEW